MHGRLSGRRGRSSTCASSRPTASCSRSAVDRLLGPRQRHRDGGRRLRARRAHRREALHAQPRDEGHRPRVLARAAGLRKLVRDLRRTRVALGDGVKTLHPSEAEPIMKMGKKLVAARDLPAGHVLTARRRRDEVAGRRAAAVRARPGARPDAAPSARRGRSRSRSRCSRSASGRRSSRRRRRARAMSADGSTGRVAVVTGALGQPRPGLGRRARRGAGATRRRARRAARATASLAGRRHRPRLARAVRDRVARDRARRRCSSTTPASTSRRARRDRTDRGRPLDEFRVTLDVNLAGAFHATQVFGAAMVRGGPRLDRQHRLALRLGLADPALLRPHPPTRRSSSRRPTAPRRRRSST